MNEDIKDQKWDKPGYDGRLKYYNIIEKYMINIANAQAISDFQVWLRLLSGLKSVTHSFWNPKDSDEISKSLNILSNDLRISYNKSFSKLPLDVVINLDNRLQVLTDKIFSASKHLLLPTKSDEETEFNENEFLGGSDL